jgi:fatty acid desaturase
MASSSKPNRSKPKAKLSDQAHQQTVDFFRIAEESKYPEIRKAALKAANEHSKYYRKQSARVSPALILWLAILFGIAVVGAWWYAFLHYPERKAYEIGSIAVLVYLVFLGVCLFLAGHLSQANFMKILGWLPAHLKSRWNVMTQRKTTPQESDSQE